MKSIGVKSIRLLLYLCLLLVVGCTNEPADTNGETPAPEGPKGPASYAEGVEALEGYVTQIRTAFEAGTPHDADGAIHDAAHACKAMAQLIKDAGMSEEASKEANGAVEKVMAGLNTLHVGMHQQGEEPVGYDEAKDDLEGGLESLKANQPAAE